MHFNAFRAGFTRGRFHGFDRTRLARGGDGHLPRPIVVHHRVGTLEHGRTAARLVASVHVDLDDLVAEPVGQAPVVGDFVHANFESGVPCALTDLQRRCIEQTAPRCEV